MGQPKPIVAVVENDRALLKAIGRLLTAGGYDAWLFSSAETYLEKRAQTGEHCLVLDVGLDGMTGLELQERLCREGCPTPVIFVTGQGDVPTIGRAVSNGCAAFLHKPFDGRLLLDALKKICASSGGNRKTTQRRR